jgi:hypothetical protein
MHMKINKNYVVAGLVGIATVTMGGATAVYAAQDGQGGKHFGTHRGGGHLVEAAELIGIPVEDLKTKIENGEKLPEILEAEGITREDMRAAHQARVSERLAQAVANGRLTQAEADARIAKRAAHQVKREAVRVAIENNDYSAWSTAMAGTPLADKVTPETFARLVEAHNLREAGDHEAAREIMEELGLKKAGHRGILGGGPKK